MNLTEKGLATLRAQLPATNLYNLQKTPALAGVGQETAALGPFWSVVVPLSAGVSAYHGLKRNHGSIPWALGWGFAGAVLPVITPAIALAQGFAKPE